MEIKKGNLRQMKVLIILVVIKVLMGVPEVWGQGCSDAGFCTVHSLKPAIGDTSTLTKNSFKLGAGYGLAQYNVSVITPYLEYTHHLGRLSLSAKLLMGIRSGELGTTSGLADIILTSSWTVNQQLQLMGGIKLPFNQADKMVNGLPLPMAYQTSLGTTDLILGANWKLNKWVVSTAWQQPINQNANTFLAEDYQEGRLNDPYLSTNEYHRSGDILIRVSRSSTLNEKWVFNYSILPIYHLSNDSYVNTAGQRQSIEDSQGLTLNLNTFIQYHLSNTSFLEFNVGAPVKARKNRPDGLSQFSVVLEYGIKF